MTMVSIKTLDLSTVGTSTAEDRTAADKANLLDTIGWIRTLASATLASRDYQNIWSALSDIVANCDLVIEDVTHEPSP